MPHSYIPLRELPLKHDFMFGQVMRNPRICKLFLEALLETELDRIEYIDTQKDLKDAYLYHGIRLDVYLNDETGTVYNIEMQANPEEYQEYRARYYQSGIDRRGLDAGKSYSELSESYIIFICDFDYFHRGLALYDRVSYLKGTDLEYRDGSHVLFLNSRYQTGNAEPEILEYLDYLRTNDGGRAYQSQLVKETVEQVASVRNNKKLEVSYMTIAMKLQDERRAGHREGLKQGLEQGLERGLERGILATIATVKELTNDPDIAVQKLMEQFDLTQQAAQEKVSQHWS